MKTDEIVEHAVEVAISNTGELVNAEYFRHHNRMKWTSEKPTVEGWYWYLAPKQTVPIVRYIPELFWEQVAFPFDSQWSGPIPPPQD